jgi:hypothetical protein
MFQLEKGKNAMRKLLLATTKNLFATACVLISLVSAAQAQGFRVTQTFLKADDGRMSGPCPMKVVFEGYITVDGPGTVAYTFTRSDGATAPIYKIEFKQAGSQSITTDWTLGDQRDLPSYSGWQAIKIISPNELESSHETGAFSIACSPAKAGIGEQTTVTNVSGNVKGSGTGNPGSGNARLHVATSSRSTASLSIMRRLTTCFNATAPAMKFTSHSRGVPRLQQRRQDSERRSFWTRLR